MKSFSPFVHFRHVNTLLYVGIALLLGFGLARGAHADTYDYTLTGNVNWTDEKVHPFEGHLVLDPGAFSVTVPTGAPQVGETTVWPGAGVVSFNFAVNTGGSQSWAVTTGPGTFQFNQVTQALPGAGFGAGYSFLATAPVVQVLTGNGNDATIDPFRGALTGLYFSLTPVTNVAAGSGFSDISASWAVGNMGFLWENNSQIILAGISAPLITSTSVPLDPVVAEVPEPQPLALFATGLLAMAFVGRRRQQLKEHPSCK